LLNNNELGKISKEQRALGVGVWKTGLSNPDFSEYASSCGALGLKVEKLSQIDDQMSLLFDHNGPGLLEIHTDVRLI
jgi:pyruvate oxidase